MFSKYRLMIFSNNPDKLMKFYRDVLKLKLVTKLEIPNDYGYKFEINGDMMIWISKHNKTPGKNKDKFRHIFNIYPKSVTKAYEEIKNAKGVKIVCKPELTPFATKEDQTYVCTWLDPENNCWQFMGPK